MPLTRLAALGLLLVAACSSTSKARPHNSQAQSEGWQQAVDVPDSYGFSPENPIHVGGGPHGQRAFLETLRGPDGQSLAWRRLGSCCEFETPNGIMGFGLLDLYEITYEGMERPVILYLDMYESGPVMAPVGFTLPSEEGPGAPRGKPKIIEL
jgi:hypothetical protein